MQTRHSAKAPQMHRDLVRLGLQMRLFVFDAALVLSSRCAGGLGCAFPLEPVGAGRAGATSWVVA